MIDIKISVSHVDYEAALDTLLPVLLEHLSKSSQNTLISSILQKTKGLSSIAAKAALKALPQETKDELAVVCLNYYREDIQRLLTEMSKQKGIAMEIERIHIAAEQGPESEK